MNHCEFVGHWFEQLWCAKNCQVIDQMMSAEVQMHGLAPGGSLGREDFRAFHAHFCRQFPNIKVTVIEAIEHADRVAIFATVSGNHYSNGKAIEMSGCGIARIDEGQIVETWESWDLLSVLVQLGEVPEQKLSILFGEK